MLLLKLFHCNHKTDLNYKKKFDFGCEQKVSPARVESFMKSFAGKRCLIQKILDSPKLRVNRKLSVERFQKKKTFKLKGLNVLNHSVSMH